MAVVPIFGKPYSGGGVLNTALKHPHTFCTKVIYIMYLWGCIVYGTRHIGYVDAVTAQCAQKLYYPQPPGRYSTYRGAYDHMKQKGGGELVTDVDSFVEGGK